MKRETQQKPVAYGPFIETLAVRKTLINRITGKKTVVAENIPARIRVAYCKKGERY